MESFQISRTRHHHKTQEPVSRRQDSSVSTTSDTAANRAVSDHHLQTLELRDLAEPEMNAPLQQPLLHRQTPCMKQPAALASVY